MLTQTWAAVSQRVGMAGGLPLTNVPGAWGAPSYNPSQDLRKQLLPCCVLPPDVSLKGDDRDRRRGD